MEIPRDARGADLIKNRYVAPQPLAPACSDGRSRIDLVDKAHLHVRFIVSKSETQKRPQRASHNAQLRSPRRAWEMEALCRRSSPKTATPCTSRPEPRLLLCTDRQAVPRRPIYMCGLSPACEKRRNGCNARLKSALRRHHAEIIVTRAQSERCETRVAAVSAFLTC